MTDKICSVCNERDPYPRWVCLSKALGFAEHGKPCSYSLDANERMRERFSCPQKAAPWKDLPYDEQGNLPAKAEVSK